MCLALVTPLVDYAADQIAAPKCDRAAASKMHAVLIGASHSGEPFSSLKGPDNDVKLIYTSLIARGAAEDDIAMMVGSYASREEIAKIFRQTLERVNCGDRCCSTMAAMPCAPAI